MRESPPRTSSYSIECLTLTSIANMIALRLPDQSTIIKHPKALILRSSPLEIVLFPYLQRTPSSILNKARTNQPMLPWNSSVNDCYYSQVSWPPQVGIPDWWVAPKLFLRFVFKYSRHIYSEDPALKQHHPSLSIMVPITASCWLWEKSSWCLTSLWRTSRTYGLRGCPTSCRSTSNELFWSHE